MEISASAFRLASPPSFMIAIQPSRVELELNGLSQDFMCVATLSTM